MLQMNKGKSSTSDKTLTKKENNVGELRRDNNENNDDDDDDEEEEEVDEVYTK